MGKDKPIFITGDYPMTASSPKRAIYWLRGIIRSMGKYRDTHKLVRIVFEHNRKQTKIDYNMSEEEAVNKLAMRPLSFRLKKIGLERATQAYENAVHQDRGYIYTHELELPSGKRTRTILRLSNKGDNIAVYKRQIWADWANENHNLAIIVITAISGIFLGSVTAIVAIFAFKSTVI